jgi:hypothetical protein
VPLVATDGTALGDKRALPALPATMHHLALLYETREGFGDLIAAAKLTDLRTLYVGGMYQGFTTIDMRPFAGAVHLRIFHCDQPRLTGTEIVAGFRELRSFAAKDFPLTTVEMLRGMTELRSFAAKDFPLATFEMLRGMTELRRVYCWGPDADDVQPRSLAPLAGLPHLEHLELLFTPIAELPATGFDSLRVLYLQDCGLPAAQQRAFRKAHPTCARSMARSTTSSCRRCWRPPTGSCCVPAAAALAAMSPRRCSSRLPLLTRSPRCCRCCASWTITAASTACATAARR